MAGANLAARVKAFGRYLIYGRGGSACSSTGTFENPLFMLEINNHLKISLMNDIETLRQYLAQEPSDTSFSPNSRPDSLFSQGFDKFVQLSEERWLYFYIDFHIVDLLRDLSTERHQLFIGTLQYEDDKPQFTIYSEVPEIKHSVPVHVHYPEDGKVIFYGTFEFNIAWDWQRRLLTTSLTHENSYSQQA
jgi:hypothetical protein